jgi:hypothetical protein
VDSHAAANTGRGALGAGAGSAGGQVTAPGEAGGARQTGARQARSKVRNSAGMWHVGDGMRGCDCASKQPQAAMQNYRKTICKKRMQKTKCKTIEKRYAKLSIND